MKHPLIKEIQLGKSVTEVVNEHFLSLNFQKDETLDRLPAIVQEIVKINNKWLRFAVQVDTSWCGIIFLNSPSDITLDYWDYENSYAQDNDAYLDCELLNLIVERLYGVKRKKAKAKITKAQFLKKKGNICPYCGRTPEILDDVTWKDRHFMGCQGCGETWKKMLKTLVTGFSQ